MIKSLVQYCKELSFLDLNHNHLNDCSALVVSDLLKDHHLRILLGFSNITQYDDIFGNHKSTEFHTLDFSSRNLAGRECEQLVSVVQSCTCSDILQLNLSKNNIAIEPFCSILAQCSNLLILDLSSNSLGLDNARILSGALRHCVKLHNLDISSNYFCTDSIQSIAGALKYCTNLLQLKASSIEKVSVLLLRV